MSQQLVRVVNVSCPLGLHVRPAAKIVKLLQDCSCKVSFHSERGSANAASLLEILMLEAVEGTELKIVAEGKDASAAMERLTAAFNEGFLDCR